MGPMMAPAPRVWHAPALFAVSGGGYTYGYGFPFYGSFAFNTVPFGYVAPLFLLPPPMPRGGGLLAGPMPPPGLFANPLPPGGEVAKPRRPDPTRAAQLVTLGDRNFRAGNVHRAAERYTQAISADPNVAAPRVRMAQIELTRGNFAEAATRYREATVAEPGWLIHAPDIQAIYAEPADFAKQIAKLETHLQADPHDRDAWFVLGAQWYLSGQTRRSADVFLRLTDRKPDASLAAFLDAARPQPPAPQ
jgi:cytochrome c-type biogenesis protein CcmH/NrfG